MRPTERVWQNPNSADVRVVVTRPGTDQIARGARRSVGMRREVFFCNGSMLQASTVLSLAVEEATMEKRQRQIQRDADAAARLRKDPPGTVPADASPPKDREREMPTIQVNADPCAFAAALAWMYGLPLEVSMEKMLEWPLHGCMELESARALGIGSLEHAVRRLIFEAASFGKTRLILALMRVSHQYELWQEFSHCCAELARSGGHGTTEALFSDVPFAVMSGLMESSSWIVDHEDDILEVFELWMRSQFKQRGQMVQWPTVAEAAGTWDIRWSAVSKEKLQMLATFGVIPMSMFEDCEAQLSCEIDRQKQLRRFINAQKDVSRMQSLVKSRKKDVEKKLQAFDESVRTVEEHQAKMLSPKLVNRSAVGQALSRATQTMNQCRIQLAIAKESLNKAESTLLGHKDTLEKCSPEAKKDSEAKYIWGEQAKRMQREDVVWRVLGKEASLWHGSVARRGRQSFSWLERRRCHHVHMEPVHGWKRHISSIGTVRDRLVIKVGTSYAEQAEEGERRATLVGKRLVAKGRHELLVRFARRCAVSPGLAAEILAESVEPVRGLRFGVAAYELKPEFQGKSAWFTQSRGGFVRTKEAQSLSDTSRGRAKLTTSAAPADSKEDGGQTRFTEERPIRRMFTSTTEKPEKTILIPEEAVNSALSGSHFNLDEKKSKIAIDASVDETESSSELPTAGPKRGNESVASSIADGEDASISQAAASEAGSARSGSQEPVRKPSLLPPKVAPPSNRSGEESDCGSSASSKFSWSDMMHIPGSAMNPYDLEKSRGGLLKMQEKTVVSLDLMILLVLDCESECLMFAAEQVDCGPGMGPALQEAAFFGRHQCLGRWSDEASLHSDLRLGAAELPRSKAFAFTIEIDAPLIAATCGTDDESHAQVEILPQAACWPSWWVDAMDRTVDDCPAFGARPVEAWASSEACVS